MERNKEQKLRQMRLETQDFLFAQMEEKEARKAQAVQLKGLQVRLPVATCVADFAEI